MELDLETTKAEFKNGYYTWQTSTCYRFGEDIFNGVLSGFTSNDSFFDNPVVTGGAVLHAIENGLIVYSTNNPETAHTTTQLVLNNSSMREFTWTTDNSFPGIITKWMHFRSTVVHETGHLLGLNHCIYSEATMFKTQYYGQDKMASLSPYDLEGIAIICRYTGIEDGITINGPTEINQNSTYTYNATFNDYPPGPDFIVSNHSWIFEVYHREGTYTWLTSTTPYYQTNWQVPLGTLPTGYCWLRNGTGVLARVKVSAVDNDGIMHEDFQEVNILGVTQSYTSQGILSSNELWCGNMVLTGNVTVPVGRTLRILPGSIVVFLNNASLIINGQLTANGQSPDEITFTSQSGTTPNCWGSITFNGSGSAGSSITNANILYGSKIEAINTSNISIQNCNITHTYDGIRLSGSTASIKNNVISTSSEGHGIIIEDASTATCEPMPCRKE